MKFSDRIGKTRVRDSIQIDGMDEVLSTKLWNTILSEFYFKLDRYSPDGRNTYVSTYALLTWSDYLNKPIDEFNSSAIDSYQLSFIVRELKIKYFESKWYEKYNLIEFIIPHANSLGFDSYVEEINKVLLSEAAGYRITQNKVVSIYDEVELNEVEDSFENLQTSSPVYIHLNTALEFLSNREKPDYRNSIKESISAVEAYLNILTGSKKLKFSETLSELEKETKLHPSLKKAFGSLYGFTSDSGGIRHSLLDDDQEVTFGDAKFMLVSCSAFINYLKLKNKSADV